MSQAARANDGTDTTLRGRWLIAVWAAWIVSFGMSMVMFIAAERLAFAELWDPQARVVAFVVTLIQLAGFFAAAAIILWRKHNDWVALLVALALVSLPLGFIDTEIAFLIATHPGWVAPEIASSLIHGGAIPLFLLFFVFPDGRMISRWAAALVLLWIPVVLITKIPSLSKPTAFDEAQSLGNAFWLGILAIGVFSQAYRYWRVSGPTERQQTRWVIVGLAGLLSGVLVWATGTYALPPLTEAPGPIDGLGDTSFGVMGRPAEIGAGVLMIGLPLAFPFSLMFAILRYRLWDIDVVINRALVYAVLTATLVGTYFGGVVLLQMAFRGVTGQGNAVAVVISTLTIAALFMPLRVRVQSFIDRRFYRRRYDASLTLAAFADRMRDEVDVDKLTGELVAAVEQTMQPAHTSLWLRAGTSTSERSRR